MPNDRAGTWAQESLTPKLLLFNHSYFSKKTTGNYLPPFSQNVSAPRQSPESSVCKVWKNHQERLQPWAGRWDQDDHPDPRSISGARAAGPCGRLTWSEDGVPGPRVRLPDPGVEAPVQFDRGDHHLSKHAHHLWGHKCLSAPCPLSHRQPAIHEWRVLSKHILCSPKAGLPGVPLGSRHQSPPLKTCGNQLWDAFPLDMVLILQEFPGGRVVRTLSLQCGDPGSVPGQGTKIPQTT